MSGRQELAVCRGGDVDESRASVDDRTDIGLERGRTIGQRGDVNAPETIEVQR